jgi:hypothetical protein
VVVSDAAKRAYDIAKSYAVFVPLEQRVNSWIALRLYDGGYDGTLYESKRDAVRHQVSEFLCAYFCYRNAPNGFASPRDAQLWLDMNRAYYDSGFRMPDPDAADGGPDVIMPLTNEDFSSQLRELIGKGY